MLPLTFIICWFFYTKLRGIDRRGNFEGFWASLYSVVIFITLLFQPSIQTLFYLGKPTFTSTDVVAHNVSTHISLPIFLSLLVSLILGILFYFTVRLPGYMTGGRNFGILIAIPGVFINGFVAYFLIRMLIPSLF